MHFPELFVMQLAFSFAMFTTAKAGGTSMVQAAALSVKQFF